MSGEKCERLLLGGVDAWYNRFLYGRYPDAEIWRINLALVILLIWVTPLWLASVCAKIGTAAGVVLLYPFWAVTLFLGGKRGLITQGKMVAAMEAFTLTVAHVGFCLMRGVGLWDSFIATMIRARMTGRAPAFATAFLAAMLLMALHRWSTDLRFQFVGTYNWGGLFLTLLIAGISITSALPAGIVLALGRRSRMLVIKALCVVYIELVRPVPLVTLMFMATTMFPLFLSKGLEFNQLALAINSVCMFATAYMAEIVRGGVQAIPLGQFEAARAMGLVVLRQALQAITPNIVVSFIELFKGTAVVSIFGLYDLTNMLGAISQSPR